MKFKIPMYILLLILSAFFYVKYFEPKFLYQPSRNFESLPIDLQLPAEDVNFKTKDNVILGGWFFPAPDENPSEFSVLYFHGNAGNISNRLPTIEFLNKLGLKVFIFDYRGYGKSDGKPSEEGLYQDGLAAYELMINQHINPSKIIFYGESIGAAVAIELAQKQKCAGLITIGAFSSVTQLAKDYFGFIPFYLFFTSKYDNLNKISNVKVPILIVHGTDDKIVPYTQAGKLFEKANDPKYFFKVDKAGHNDIFKEGKVPLKKTLHLFVEKLGGEENDTATAKAK